MKKFSNSINVNINDEPKIKKVEENPLKFKVNELIDQYLRITTYGPVDRYLRGGSIKITGKETFLEALIDLIENKSKEDIKSVLEGLKSEIFDWEKIDEKIEQIGDSKLDLIKYKRKLKSIYNKWSGDEELCLEMFNKHIEGLNDPNTALYNHLAANELSKDNNFFEKISEKYLLKSKKLGFE